MIDSKQDEAVKLEADIRAAFEESRRRPYVERCYSCPDSFVLSETGSAYQSLHVQEAYSSFRAGYLAALTPANLNAPDKQEALAGEGVEARLRLALEQVLATSGARGRYHALEYAEAVERAEALLAADPQDTLPSNEALAGDDRNGVEGLREALDDLQQAEAEYRLMHDRHGDGAQAAGRAWDLMRRAGDKARTTLSRTPSSPQADEADVERLLEKAIDHVGKRWSGYAGCHAYACAVGREVAISALSLTRPAGGEEVGWTIEHGPVEGSVYLTASMGWSKHRASAIRFARKVDADDMIEANGWEDFRVAALTKPAALPKEASAGGTFACPICGKDTPHHHSKDDQLEPRHDKFSRPALPKGEDLEQLILDARVAACGTRLTCREREVIRALCDAVEGRGALPKEGEEDELRFWLRKAGEVLAPHSGDAPGTPTRDALVFVNAGLFPQARERVRAALAPPPQAQEE